MPHNLWAYVGTSEVLLLCVHQHQHRGLWSRVFARMARRAAEIFVLLSFHPWHRARRCAQRCCCCLPDWVLADTPMTLTRIKVGHIHTDTHSERIARGVDLLRRDRSLSSSLRGHTLFTRSLRTCHSASQSILALACSRQQSCLRVQPAMTNQSNWSNSLQTTHTTLVQVAQSMQLEDCSNLERQRQ